MCLGLPEVTATDVKVFGVMLAKCSSAPPGSSRWQEQHKNIPQLSPSSLSLKELWLRAKLGCLAEENKGKKPTGSKQPGTKHVT